MELFEDLIEAISMPKCIQISENLLALRFESMKLASCSAAVESLLMSGQIDGETTLVDSSSGIYAYALALTCQRYSLPCHIIASTTVDKTLLLQLEALGASVEKVPPSKSLKYDQEFRVRRVHEYLAANFKSYWMRQYHDRIHYKGYQEIGTQLGVLLRNEFGNISINLVCAIGSGASSGGLFNGLTRACTDVWLTGIQPFGSISFGSENIEDPDILVAGIGSAIPFGNIEYSIFANIHWLSAEVARQGTMRLLTNTGIFGGLSAGAAYTVGQYLSESDSSNLTLFVCPDMGYRYAHILEGTQISSHIVRAPRWIATLDELAPPWCAMEWNGTPFTPTPTSTHKKDDTNG